MPCSPAARAPRQQRPARAAHPPRRLPPQRRPRRHAGRRPAQPLPAARPRPPRPPRRAPPPARRPPRAAAPPAAPPGTLPARPRPRPASARRARLCRLPRGSHGCALHQSSWERKRRPCDGAARRMVFAEARGAPAARPGRRGAQRRPAPRAPAAAPRWPARAPPPPATGAPCMWACTPERGPPALKRFAPTQAYHAVRSRTTHVMAS